MMPALVKICGNVYPEDSHAIAALSPDFMGWIFSPRSVRRVRAAAVGGPLSILRRKFPRIAQVAVFAENSLPEMMRILYTIPYFDAVQISAPAAQVLALRRLCRAAMQRGDLPPLSIWPVLRPRGPVSWLDRAQLMPAALTLLDSYAPGQAGGTGQQLNPEWARPMQSPFLLAGGLNAENVSEALLRSGAIGADVASGIESSPGRKDLLKAAAFISAVRAVAAPSAAALRLSAIRARRL